MFCASDVHNAECKTMLRAKQCWAQNDVERKTMLSVKDMSVKDIERKRY